MIEKADCYDYIRRMYQVPAFVGVEVTVAGRRGRIVASKSNLHWIKVRWDGSRQTGYSHPEDATYHGVRLDVDGGSVGVPENAEPSKPASSNASNDSDAGVVQLAKGAR